MRYYVISDIHGFYTQMENALSEAGFFSDTEPHKLVILGDLMDRGKEAVKMQEFVLQQMERDSVILIRGNHEDLFESFVTEDHGIAYDIHVSNGTFDTALQLTGYDPVMAGLRNYDFADKAKTTPFYQKIMPSMLDYYETAHYVFVHGWIPCIAEQNRYNAISNWRKATPDEWLNARWYNGMDAAQSANEDKIIVCGHWHTSYGHSKYEGKGSEFGADANFAPYYGPHMIAIDACTAFTKKVNCLVLED